MPLLPHEVLFEVMRSSFRITYRDLCELILSDKPIGGLSPRERGRDAARRNREFVHVAPGADDAYWKLAPHEEYVANLFDRIVDSFGKDEGVALIIEVLSASGAGMLRESLDACKLDGSIYSNIINYILDGFQADNITACMLLHLFVATSVSGKPDQSAQEVIRTAYSLNDDTVRTATPPIHACESISQPKQNLALMRCAGTALYPTRTYLLSSEPGGTDVGSIVLSPGCITDVERGVSRAHLHIWRDEKGTWWCKGLLSLNGSVLVDGGIHEHIVIEPPRDERPEDYEPRAYPLRVGDILILAGNTEFIVVSVGA